MANYGGLSATYHANRLAGTIINGVPQYDFDGACVIWATNVIPGHGATRGCGDADPAGPVGTTEDFRAMKRTNGVLE